MNLLKTIFDLSKQFRKLSKEGAVVTIAISAVNNTYRELITLSPLAQAFIVKGISLDDPFLPYSSYCDEWCQRRKTPIAFPVPRP